MENLFNYFQVDALSFGHCCDAFQRDTFFSLFMDFMTWITVKGGIWILPFLSVDLGIYCSAAGGWSFTTFFVHILAGVVVLC